MKLVTLSYAPSLGGFDDRPLAEFVRDKEVLAVREHFFSVHDLPHLACLVTYQDNTAPSREPAEPKRKGRPDPFADLAPDDRPLFNTLREWRAARARKDGVPPYVLGSRIRASRRGRGWRVVRTVLEGSAAASLQPGASSLYTRFVKRHEIEARLKEVLASHPGLVAGWLFGSVARGTDRAASDVDVAVLYEKKPPSVLGSPPMKLEGELERALRRPVQVVCLNTAPPDLGIRVLRHGRRLLENDRSARIRFEVRLRNVFWDLEPILRRCRKQEPSRK